VEHRREVQGDAHVLAPTAIRVLRKQAPEFMRKHDKSSLKALYLAGEPLDETTSSWIAGELGVPIIDNYWQTETGWPILHRQGHRRRADGWAAPAWPCTATGQAGERATGEECGANEKGVVMIEGPLPPGCMQTVYGDDQRFVDTYWTESTARCCTPPSTGACAMRTATTSSSAAPTT
jgi:propionyl-CoA synthetase